MDSSIWLILNTRKGVKLISKEFEGDLFTRATLIYLVFGVLLYILFISDFSATWGGAANWLLLFLTPTIILIYGTVMSKLLFYIGRLIGSSARYYEVFTVHSYSMIPIMIGFGLLVLLTKMPLIEPPLDNSFNRNVVTVISLFVSFKVMILSLKRLSGLNLIVTFLNILPIAILPTYLMMEVFHLFDVNDVMQTVYWLRDYLIGCKLYILHSVA